MEKNKCGQMEYSLTMRMEEAVKGLKGKYASLYDSKDFEIKIAYLKRCNLDEKGTVQNEIVDMFKKCGVEGVLHGQSPDYYSAVLKDSNISTPEELRHAVYESFLEEFIKHPFPKPEEYIARIVKEKVPFEWENDSLRLQILKTFIRDADALSAAGYKDLYIKQYIRKKINKNRIDVQDIIDNLDENVFDCLNTDNRQQDGKNNKGKDTHQQLRKNNTYGLLKIADDLAHGRFGNANVAREEIYLFAVVFELKYLTGDSEELVTPEDRNHDIEQVMFGDYYANNLMRYVSNNHKYIKRGGEEQNPTGKGINYKNYMEVIFLYYLKRNDLSIKEKLYQIYNMAYDVHNMYKEIHTSNQDTFASSKGNNIDRNNTLFYKSKFSELVLETEEEFSNYLIYNYDCHIEPRKTTVFSTKEEQKSAYCEYIKLLKDAELEGVCNEDFKYRGVFFLEDEVDLDLITQIQKERESGRIDFDSLDNKTKFDIVLYEVDRDLKKKKGDKELERKIVSRADIIRLFYQYYINYMENDAEDFGQRFLSSFPEIYDDFVDCANHWLTSALLRPINGRDLYDLIIIYSAYCYINQDKLF